MQYVIDSANPH